MKRKNMGEVFELIADEALEKLDDHYTECHVCDRTNVDLYVYAGTQYDRNGQKLDDYYDSYAVCADCINASKVTHICDFEYIKTIDAYLAGSDLNNQLVQVCDLYLKCNVYPPETSM